jgi:hypothetical protein
MNNMDQFISKTLLEYDRERNLSNFDELKFYNTVYLSFLYLYQYDCYMILKNHKLVEMINNIRYLIDGRDIARYRFYYDIKVIQLEFKNNKYKDYIMPDVKAVLKAFQYASDFESFICKGFLIQKESFELLMIKNVL